MCVEQKPISNVVIKTGRSCKPIVKPERLVYNRTNPIRLERRKHVENHVVSHDEKTLYVYACHVHVYDALCWFKNAFCSVQKIKVF